MRLYRSLCVSARSLKIRRKIVELGIVVSSLREISLKEIERVLVKKFYKKLLKGVIEILGNFWGEMEF